MSLSRLSNFLRSVRGTILYVDPNSIDSTDSIENLGNSISRPFKTIQRALIEASRFSYQRGLNNDRFGKTTILLYPGDHIVDNRPGWIPLDDGITYRLRNGESSNDFLPFDESTNFNVQSEDNALYKLNSIHGGVIIPRGTSLVGLDLRKTTIRPKYVPNPTNDSIERSSIFRVTGACYFWQFSLFDANPNDFCYKDYTNNIFVPNFSHHKLSCFEYADGTNPISISDDFLTYSDSERTDLDMYYEKVGRAYGFASGRAIEPDYPSASLDIEPKIDEYRIVGSTGLTVGITSIFAGDGVTSSTTITVTTADVVPGLEVDTPIRIEGVSTAGYNGSFVVSNKLSPTQVSYTVQNSPTLASAVFTGSSLSLSSDTVTSASPYIFNISLRSVYGMCGVLADGSKASGFKSMVVAQFTGIGLQKDDNAFVVYNETTGSYEDNTVSGNETISSNSRAIHKPAYRNFHIKCINDAFIQNVSIFAIGYAEQFSVDSGGDQSVTNSNSNFGAKALVASGFRKNAFPQDDYGYITHIIPPKDISIDEVSLEFNAIDVEATINAANSGRLYLYDQKNSDVPPDHVIEGYRIGSRENDALRVLVSTGGSVTEYSSRIVMQNSINSREKSFSVGRSVSGINSITSNIITLTENHTIQNGESIRIISQSGELPDGISPNRVYYAITDGLTSSQIKVAETINNAKELQSLSINNRGGELVVSSRVSDKISGEIGHPIQYDTSRNQWYVGVSTVSSENEIYSIVNSLGAAVFGSATSRTYINRKKYERSSTDSIYRVRYVIPADTDGAYARPPSDGFIIQESNNCTGDTATEIETYFGTGSLTKINQQRNYRFIANAEWSGNVATFTTELPHNLKIGDEVELVNITSTSNTSGDSNKGFNREYTVTNITSTKEFKVELTQNPGTFTNDTSVRTTSLPYFKRKKYRTIFYIYRIQEAQRYIGGKQDGIYYLTLLNSSNSPNVDPFDSEKFTQPVKELYPQIDRDNIVSDPDATKSYASSSLIGNVVVNDVRNSATKETIEKFVSDSTIGIGITDIFSSSGTGHTVTTFVEHGLNGIIKLNLVDSGAGYDSGGTDVTLYNVSLVGIAESITGRGATAKVTITPSGNIGNISIMDGGSAYGIGNTLTIVGIATTTGYTPATIEVLEVRDNVGDVIRVSGITSISLSGYNNIYRITDVPVGSATTFTVESSEEISNYTEFGKGAEMNSAFFSLVGKSVPISNLVYDNVTGIATLTSSSNHGFFVGNKVRISGATSSLYNGDFIVTDNISLTEFNVKVGIATTVPTTSGTIYAYGTGLTSHDGVIGENSESISGRMLANYAGISTHLRLQISSESTDEIYLEGIDNLDLKIGDFLQIDDEILRIKDQISSSIISTDPITVFRGVLGTKPSTHIVGSTVRKINILPVELRRHSIIRASGHTFEYVGFGPGNYSTAFPDKQDRQITAQEELLAQSTKKGGGVNFYTGMNDKGVSYAGNKKLTSITGLEEIFDTPIQTITGEDIGSQQGLHVITPIEGSFSRSIKVEGGEDSRAISEFNGPVVFREKITSTSSKGIEVNSLFLQGQSKVSRKYTLGRPDNEKPTLAGNPGDVQYNASPSNAGYMGWVYTSNNEWKRFGKIEPDDFIGFAIRESNGSITGIGSIVEFKSEGIVINKEFSQTEVSSQYGLPVGIATFTFIGQTAGEIFGGRVLTGSSGNRWGVMVTVESDGQTEIGRYLDFHNSDGDTSDYTYRLDNSSSGVLSASGSLSASSDISLGGELNFTGVSNKYIDFYTNTGNTANLRLVNSDSTSFHNGITLERGGAVTLFHNGSSKLATASGGVNVTGTLNATTFVGNLTGNVTGNVTGNLTNSVSGTDSADIVRGNMNGNNDFFRIRIGATATDAGFVEIATADNGSEPIYVRQYTGVFTSLARTATLLDGSGNTSFPGTVVAPTFNGDLLGNATSATSAVSATTATNANNINIAATNSSDTSCSLVLVGSQSTGNQIPFIDGGLSYDANSNILYSGTFSGSLSGNASSASTVTINYNNDSNSTYQMLWGSSTSVYGTSGIYCNPYYDTLYATNFSSQSDIRLKKEISSIENALERLSSFRGVNFVWKKTDVKTCGVIAQEVEKVFPELVEESGETKSVNYNGLVAVLIESVKELSNKVKELESKLGE